MGGKEEGRVVGARRQLEAGYTSIRTQTTVLCPQHVTGTDPIWISQDSHWQQPGTTHIHINAITGPTDPVMHLRGLTEQANSFCDQQT